jgi:hypothetical protein
MSIQISYLFTDATYQDADEGKFHRDDLIDAYMNQLGFERVGSGSDGSWRDIEYEATPEGEILFMDTPSFKTDLCRIAGSLTEISYDDGTEGD